MKKKVVKVQPVKPVINPVEPIVKEIGVKIVTVKTIVPRKCFLGGQQLDFLRDETRVLRSDKIKSFDEVLLKLTQAGVIKILEVKEE